MTIVLSLLKRYWKQLAILIIIGTLLGIIQFKSNTIESQEAQILSLTTNIAVLNTQITECRSQIDSQNKSIQAAAAASQKNIAAMDDLAKSLLVLQKDQKSAIVELRNRPAPKSCEEIQNYLKKAAEELREW